MLDVTLLVRTRGEEFEEPLDRSMTVGRSSDAGLFIDDDGLSRIHASIFFDGEQVWVADENSTNGTFVNEQQVIGRDVYLKDGDTIRVGNHTTIKVLFHNADAQGNGYENGYESSYDEPKPAVQTAKPKIITQQAKTKTVTQPATSQAIFSPMFLIILSSVLVMVIGIVAVVLILSSRNRGGGAVIAQTDRGKGVQDPLIRSEIPDLPLEDVWDVQEQEISTEDEQVVSDEDWRQALKKATEPRSGPTGLDAAGSINIPPELRSKPGFLAIQAATAIADGLKIPHDYAELAQFVRENQYVELKLVGDGYVIYAVGGGASEATFTHFLKETGRSVPLFRDTTAYQSGLQSAPNKDLTEQFYKSKQGFSVASSELDTLNQLAQSFNGKTFDLNAGNQRKLYRRKILTFLRPTTLAFLEELGRTYKARFNRPLAVSSLVRTLEYQTELSKRNANAAKNDIPPHTTGCAIDLSYKYMNAEEQNFLMAEIAKYEKMGRVEALRENNNCYHIFVFPKGQPPPVSVIRQAGG